MLTAYAEPEAYRTRQENFKQYLDDKYQREREYEFDNGKGDLLVKYNAFATAEFLSEVYSMTTDCVDIPKTFGEIRVLLVELRTTLCARGI